MFLPLPLHPPLRDDLSQLRQRVRAFAATADLCPCRTQDLVIAAYEAAATLIRIGSPDATLGLWADPAGVSLHLYDPTGTLTDVNADPIGDAWTRSPADLSRFILSRLCEAISLDRDHGASRLHLHMRPPAISHAEGVRPLTCRTL